ncbi:MAG: ATP-binding cassette domain-containing protein [Gammaproteobacteria bacterium]|nr:ATP-binding cassette domain-containing protein [Gammaproteobacteria bacterium]
MNTIHNSAQAATSITSLSEKTDSQSELLPAQNIRVQVNKLSLKRSGRLILNKLNLRLLDCGITSIIGPSGAGKTSLLRCVNGLDKDWKGDITIDGIASKRWPKGEDALRQHIGLIGQKPTVFPCSIANNVMFGIRGKLRKKDNSELIEHCLKQAALWDEVCDRLDHNAQTLSLGQQQRLCIARALAVKPAVLLLDEPTASLDPRSKNKIEASLQSLSKTMPIVVVTHDLEQVRRLGGHTLFMCDGILIEQANSATLLDTPQRVETREFFQWSSCDCPPEENE